MAALCVPHPGVLSDVRYCAGTPALQMIVCAAAGQVEPVTGWSFVMRLFVPAEKSPCTAPPMCQVLSTFVLGVTCLLPVLAKTQGLELLITLFVAVM